MIHRMYQLFQHPDDGPSILIQTFQTLDEAHKWWQAISVDADGPQHFLTENKRIIAVESPRAPRLVFV
jgi:hypothetical protein